MHVLLCVTLLFIPAVFGAAYERPKPILEFPFSENLDDDGNYQLYWKPNKTHVTFEVHVKTRGYVGFGISPNGRMYPADIVVGWVKDGKTYFTVNKQQNKVWCTKSCKTLSL